MDKKNDYRNVTPYETYCNNTNEKVKLHKNIGEAFAETKLKKILDLGCGNGVNTAFIADLFPKAQIDAIERSDAQLELAKLINNKPNINYQLISFEKYCTKEKYDFVLVSHILQYTNSDLDNFVKKALSLLAPKGELWIIQQTTKGMSQIIKHQKTFLTNPRFKNWKIFEDYKEIIKKIANNNYEIRIDFLDSSFKQINFQNPTEEDKLRLEFIFCLHNSFNKQSRKFKEHLAKLRLGNGNRILHPNGIIKIRRKK